MSLRSNTGAGQTSGTTVSITNSDDFGESQFDYVAINGASALTYDNTHTHVSSMAFKVAPVASNATHTQYGGTTGNLNSDDTAADGWFYLTANPTAEFTLIGAFNTGGTRRININIETAGKVKIRDEGVPYLWTSTASIPLNAWFRIRCYSRNQGSGASFLKITFTDESGAVLDSFSTSTAIRTEQVAAWAYGKTGTDASATAFWMSELKAETAATNYIGGDTYRWTGNGVADGTTITTGNVNTAGNGDTVARAVSGSPIMTFRGDGFEYTGGTADIGRLDITPASTTTLILQFFFTPTAAPVSGVEQPAIAYNTTPSKIFGFTHQVSNVFQLNYATGSSATSPAITLNNRYQVDIVLTLSAVPTTTNGRVACRVMNLTTQTWNTTGDWFVDTGYTINLGTANIGGVAQGIRYGKNNVGNYSGNMQLLEQLGWDYTPVDPADTSRAAIEQYYMDSPYVATTAWLGA